MNQISYEERKKVYMNALITYGDRVQMVKCLEELAECQQAICKILIGGENFDHLAEEIADATVTLEQMRLLFNINDAVCSYMDAKVRRLDERLRQPGFLVENGRLYCAEDDDGNIIPTKTLREEPDK